MVFALKENNYITLHMMQDYLDVGDELLLRDPDELGNYSVEELQDSRDVHGSARDPDAVQGAPRRIQADAHRPADVAAARTTNSSIVPTNSLYIECLVGTHPLLEDFKLIHRALDVKKVQAEVRHAELENIRLAARALRGQGRGSGHREEDRDRGWAGPRYGEHRQLRPGYGGRACHTFRIQERGRRRRPRFGMPSWKTCVWPRACECTIRRS